MGSGLDAVHRLVTSMVLSLRRKLVVIISFRFVFKNLVKRVN